MESIHLSQEGRFTLSYAEFYLEVEKILLLAVVTEPERTDCDVCGEIVPEKSALAHHSLLVHNAVVEFGTDGQAEAAAGTSEGVAQFPCSICGHVFRNYPRMVGHCANVHFKEELAEFVKDPLSSLCKLCDKTLSDQQSLLSHLANVHGALKGRIPSKDGAKRMGPPSTMKARQTSSPVNTNRSRCRFIHTG
jgi:uncharacterized C2H2 Zn-finger protein